MIEAIKAAIESRMKKTIEALQTALAALRTGRAHPSWLEEFVRVDGAPLSHLANISLADAKTLLVTPWDKTTLQAIAKAILAADLGLNPMVTGHVVRVPWPPLTADRRRELIKLVKQETESARVSVRNHRREANTRFKELLKKKDLSKDQEQCAQELIQKLTDQYINGIDKIAAIKEKELMEI